MEGVRKEGEVEVEERWDDMSDTDTFLDGDDWPMQ